MGLHASRATGISCCGKPESFLTPSVFNRRAVYDYGHILHEIQLNAWVLAYRRASGGGLVSWDGERNVEPPPDSRNLSRRFEGDWSTEGLRDERPRLIRPDAVLEVRRDDGDEQPYTVLVEFDRTRRVDKNFEKFRRYDAFLTWWWRYSEFADIGAPLVMFIRQDTDQREQFLRAADRELTGHLWHASAPADRHEYVGRHRILFARERDVHTGKLEVFKVPRFPAGHPVRVTRVRRVRLPGPATPAESGQLTLIPRSV